MIERPPRGTLTDSPVPCVTRFRAWVATPALADPYRDESGKRGYSWGDRDRWDGRRDWRDDDWDDRDRRRYRRSAIPAGHLPPPGECRVWFYDRPAGQQPPPTSCREARRIASRFGGRVIYGG